MTGMSMPQRTGYGGAAGYLGAWMAMMVPRWAPVPLRVARTASVAIVLLGVLTIVRA